MLMFLDQVSIPEPKVAISFCRRLATSAVSSMNGTSKFRPHLCLIGCLGFCVIVGPQMVSAVGANATPEEFQQFLQERIQAGDPPSWFVTAIQILMLSAAFWVAGLVCAILGVQKRHRRRFALAALGVLSLPPLIICAGLVAGPG